MVALCGPTLGEFAPSTVSFSTLLEVRGRPYFFVLRRDILLSLDRQTLARVVLTTDVPR